MLKLDVERPVLELWTAITYQSLELMPESLISHLSWGIHLGRPFTDSRIR